MFSSLVSLSFLFVGLCTNALSFRCYRRHPTSLSMRQLETINIDRVFDEKLSRRTYYSNNRDADTNFLIINDPDVTMGHPLLGIDIEAEVRRIRTLRLLPSSRMKAMFAVVTGVGRGKTRLLVELDLELKKHPNVCSIAITFNHNWISRASSFITNPERRYAAAIISRIISIHYRVPFFPANEIAEELVTACPGASPEELIQGCIRYIIKQLRQDSPNVDHFVLLVDESLMIETELKCEDIHRILRQCLLDSPLMGTDDMPLYVDLVMSSLDIKSTGLGDSGREILAITTPSELDADEVLEKWVKKHVAIHDDSAMTDSGSIEMRRNVRKLKSLIACLSLVPRSLQFMVMVLKKMGGNTLFDAMKMKELYEGTMTAVNNQYSKSQQLPARYGKALLFGEKIVLDDTFMDLIKKSVFTNSLKTLSAGMVLCPETSIVSMNRLSIATSRLEAPYATVIVNVIDSLLDNLMIPSGIEDAGMPLEIIMRGLIDARLQVLVDMLDAEKSTDESRMTFTLQSLLMMKPTLFFNDENVESKSSLFFLETHKMRISPGAGTQTGQFPRTNNFCDTNLSKIYVLGTQHILQ